jgi:hypothetical protein
MRGDVRSVRRAHGAFLDALRVRSAPLVLFVGLLLSSACSPSQRGPSTPAFDESTLVVPRLDGGGSMEPNGSNGGVRFGRVPPRVGSRWSVNVQARSTTGDPQGGVQVSEYVSSYTVEILGANGPAPSRVRLVFEKNVQRYQGVDKATVVDGKTYVVDATPPHVRDDAGAPALEEERERVLDMFPDLGTRPQIDQVLPDGAMALGDERNELAGAILRVIHPRAWSLEKGSAVLARTDGDDAVFTIALDATGTNGLRIDVKGEARIRLRDARLGMIALEGTYEQAKGRASDPGTFVLRRTVRDL